MVSFSAEMLLSVFDAASLHRINNVFFHRGDRLGLQSGFDLVAGETAILLQRQIILTFIIFTFRDVCFTLVIHL